MPVCSRAYIDHPHRRIQDHCNNLNTRGSHSAVAGTRITDSSRWALATYSAALLA